MTMNNKNECSLDDKNYGRLYNNVLYNKTIPSIPMRGDEGM